MVFVVAKLCNHFTIFGTVYTVHNVVGEGSRMELYCHKRVETRTLVIPVDFVHYSSSSLLVVLPSHVVLAGFVITQHQVCIEQSQYEIIFTALFGVVPPLLGNKYLCVYPRSVRITVAPVCVLQSMCT